VKLIAVAGAGKAEFFGVAVASQQQDDFILAGKVFYNLI